MNHESKRVAVKCCGAVERLDEAHCSHHVAAVDLLASVKEMLEWIGGLPIHVDSSYQKVDCQEMMERARFAIKKANNEGKYTDMTGV